jgi:hypothetical protein
MNHGWTMGQHETKFAKLGLFQQKHIKFGSFHGTKTGLVYISMDLHTHLNIKYQNI